MVRPAAMQPVELLEHDERDEPEDHAASVPPGRLRRRRRRWLVLSLAVLMVLAGAQGVTALREQAAYRALAAVPGVVLPVDQDLRVLWAPPQGAEAVLWSGIRRDGAMIGTARGADGAQSLLAVDEATGATRWSAPLAEVAEPPEDGSPLGGCLPVPQDAGRALCLVTDAYQVYAEASVSTVLGQVSRLVVLDTDDGTVLTETAAPGAVSFTALPGTAVVAVQAADGATTLVGTDLADGHERWRTPLPVGPVRREPDDGQVHVGGVALFLTSDGVGAVTPPGVMTLLDRDGDVIRTAIDVGAGWEVDPVTHDVTIGSSPVDESQSTTFLHADGADVVLRGRRLPLSADDGSVPDLVLMSGDRVRAYDRGGSTPRWSVAASTALAAVLVRGRVYVGTDDAVVAVDARTGDEIWRTPLPRGRSLTGLLTDGRHLLAAQQRAETSDEAAPDDWPGVGEVAAYRFEDGGEAWRTDLPDGLMGLWSTGSTLVGWGQPGSVVLG